MKGLSTVKTRLTVTVVTDTEMDNKRNEGNSVLKTKLRVSSLSSKLFTFNVAVNFVRWENEDAKKTLEN